MLYYQFNAYHIWEDCLLHADAQDTHRQLNTFIQPVWRSHLESIFLTFCLPFPADSWGRYPSLTLLHNFSYFSFCKAVVSNVLKTSIHYFFIIMLHFLIWFLRLCVYKTRSHINLNWMIIWHELIFSYLTELHCSSS